MNTIWLVLALPLLGSLLCATHYRALGKVATGMVASLAILGAFAAAVDTWFRVQAEGEYTAHLATWLQIPGVAGVDVAALADPLSATMLCTVTGVAFLIHCFSMGYMSDEELQSQHDAGFRIDGCEISIRIMNQNSDGPRTRPQIPLLCRDVNATICLRHRRP